MSDSPIPERMLDSVFDILSMADMEIVYVDRSEGHPVYSEAGIDAREPLRTGISAIALDALAAALERIPEDDES